MRGYVSVCVCVRVYALESMSESKCVKELVHMRIRDHVHDRLLVCAWLCEYVFVVIVCIIVYV